MAEVSAQVTSGQPKDPRWDYAREVSEQLRHCGRLFLRGQVKLGMILAALKKESCQHGGPRTSKKKQVADSATSFSWAERVKQETGYCRKSCDEFIRLYEATKVKLKKGKKLNLPASADALICLFQADNALALTAEQWAQVDGVIGTLTSGETQASLMQELGLVPKPKAMPKASKGSGPSEDQPTAGQLSFHFFEAMIAPVINARCNPDYKKLLYALPTTSSEDHPLSLATLEAECRAMLADITEAQNAGAKCAKGRVVR